MQQHAIPPTAIDLLLDYSTSMRSWGAESFFFDKAARCWVARDLGDAGIHRFVRFLNAYAVVSGDGDLITAAWCTRRLHRA